MHLANGLPWTIPVTLAVDGSDAPAVGTDVALDDPQGNLRGVMHVADVYRYDKRHEAREVYRTEDEQHPGVAAIYAQGTRWSAAPSTCCRRQVRVSPINWRRPRPAPPLPSAAGAPSLASRRATPCIARMNTFRSARWRSSMASCCIRWSARRSRDDIPADVRMRCYIVLLRQLLSARSGTAEHVAGGDALCRAA